MAKAKTKQQLTIENQELQARLQELEDTLEAIRSGAVDAIVTSGPAGDRVYTLEGADHAYHTMVESMNEGAVTVLTDGTILYANRQFGQMTGASPSDIVGRPFHDFVQSSDRPIWSGFISQGGSDGLKAEIRLGNQSAAGIPVQISSTPIDLRGTKALALVVTDLSDRRRYEDIVAAERLSRYILEQSLEGVAVCINGRILFASRRLHEIYGGNPLMQPFDRLFPLRTSERETFSVEIPQSGTVVKNAEVSYRNPDGESYVLILNAGPLYGDEHKILGCLISLTDITERKRAEERLRESEIRFREMAETVPDILFTARLDGSLDYVNERGLAYAGLPARQAMGDGWLKVVHPEDADRSTQSVAESLRTGRPYEFTQRLRAADGSYRWFMVRARAIRDEDGKIVRWFGTAADIHDMMMAEEALRESDEQFRVLIQNLQSAVALINERGAFMIVNRSFLRMFEFASDADILNVNNSDWSLWHVFDERGALLDVDEHPVRKALLTGRAVQNQLIAMQAPGSTVRKWILVSAEPILDAREHVHRLICTYHDITERKQAEKDLQESEARFRLLSGTAGRLLATDDPQGLVKELCTDVMEYLDCQAFFNFMVDERAGRLRLNACAGIPKEEVLKLEWLDYGVAVCGCVARDGARIVAEDIFHTPDARTELVKSYGIQAYCCHPLKAGDRLIGTLSFGTKTRARFTPDEVELMRAVADQVAVAMQRIRAQHEIVDSNQRLQLALDAGGMGMWAWDLQTNQTMWNPKEYELMGLPAGDRVVDAEEFFRYVHPEDAQDLREAVGEVIARGSLFVREFRIVRADGQTRWLASLGRVIRAESGQPLSIIGINYDITDRKNMLEVLRESEERFRGVFEQSFSGIVLCDFKGRILEVNPTFCRMMGYTERELVGRKILDLTHPEDREIEIAKVSELKEERLNGFRLEKRFLGKGDRIIWAEIGVSALHDDKGDIGYALGVVEDITERKAAEEELRHSKDELEEKVNERTAELMLLLEELEKGRDDLRKLASELVMTEERERKRIAVTLHDEVAQTLAAAKMRLDLLRKVTDGQASSEVVDEARDLLMQSIRETRALMTDISSPILYEMGLPAAVQNLAEQTSASYGLTVSHDVTGEFANLGQELTVMIYQAVRELLHNVSKHSQARNVSVRVIAEDTAVRAIVADDGRGFEVGDVGLPRREGGFGLFSIRERVKSFHGSMHIESAPGKGTVVTVVLPSSLRQAQETRVEEKASPRGGRRRKT